MQTTHPLHEKAVVTRGELNVNTARKIVAVLTPENHTEWIDNAKTMKQKDLEKAVAASNPQQAVNERIQPVCANRLEMEKTDPVKKAERFTARQVAEAQANPKSRKFTLPFMRSRRGP